jgi:hypothetical protein
MNDELIGEIRTIRHSISKEFSHDPQKYIDYLKSQNHKYTDQIQQYKKLSEHKEGLLQADCTT